jgi:hypothetical protein
MSVFVDWYHIITLFQVTEDGKYCLVLIFEAKSLQLSDFEKRQVKIVQAWLEVSILVFIKF